MAEKKKQKHFVLVHGLCHGAWCWYKLKPQLESAGHKVTVLDLAASGINMKTFGHDVPTFNDYTRPLLGFLASLNEQAILVGHSFGGMSLALAMDLFPHKISVAVFLTAFMPDTIHQPSYVLDKSFKSNVFELKDLELAKTLVRPGSLFQQELSKAKNFSDEGYGSVTRVYVVCDEDKAINLEVQRWMIQNNPPKDVLEIKGADHMAMLSKTKQVCDSLLEIANKYAN
ncbi:putative Polyneuridine-aldehyde esterase precursor [Corchorus olitorius]|uniref:Polyneuridine-aldehyde esterase n=1 Tax=Corchorus olitorius TaxID=93759 RepID=A0A1R3K4U6_9ROSI|nr:putative Polyneuridine-aldehyde esterase precursor [Corchorus olitorius]